MSVLFVFLFQRGEFPKGRDDVYVLSVRCRICVPVFDECIHERMSKWATWLLYYPSSGAFHSVLSLLAILCLTLEFLFSKVTSP